MINSIKINRRDLLKNTTLLMGGLFVGGRLWAQTTSTVPGTTSQVPPTTGQVPGTTPGNPPDVIRDPSRRPDDPFRGSQYRYPGNYSVGMYGMGNYGYFYGYGYYGTGYGYYGTSYGSSIRR